MMNQAQWEYTPSIDAGYIKVSDKPFKRTEELAEGIMVDLDADGKVVGIELLGIMAALNKARKKARVRVRWW